MKPQYGLLLASMVLAVMALTTLLAMNFLNRRRTH